MTPEQTSKSEALRAWALRLLDENNSLGESLLDYANAWREELAVKPSLKFAGWFSEINSGMSYRLWEQGGHAPHINDVALYEVQRLA